MITGVPSTKRELKDVNISVDDITEKDEKIARLPAKRRHSCLPGLLHSDPANPGRRNSAHLQSNKKEPWYPISI